MGGIGVYGDSELLKSFRSDIQDGGHLEILQTTSPAKPQVRLSRNLMGGMGEMWSFSIVKIVWFQYQILRSWRLS